MNILLKSLYIVIFIFLLLFLLFFVFIFYPIFNLEVLSGKYENYFVEVFVKILFLSPPFVIFCVPYFLLKNNTETTLKKLYLYIILSACFSFMFFIGALRAVAQNEYYTTKYQVNMYNFSSAENIKK